MHIAIIASRVKQKSFAVQQTLASWLTHQGIHVTTYDNDFSEEVAFAIQKSDMIVSLGGDGSLLRLVHHITPPLPPIIGVNIGTLGFLTEITPDNLIESFSVICAGNYVISERLILEGIYHNSSVGFAINEISMHRGCFPHIIDISLYEDQSFINTFSADGIIIATPSGSTAYSLSAGGPIVTPELQAMIITPICPHMISNRPVVMMPKQELSLQLSRGPDTIDMCFDGQQTVSIQKGDVFKIRKHPHPFKLVTLSTNHHLATVRSKLGWAGSYKQPTV